MMFQMQMKIPLGIQLRDTLVTAGNLAVLCPCLDAFGRLNLGDKLRYSFGRRNFKETKC